MRSFADGCRGACLSLVDRNDPVSAARSQGMGCRGPPVEKAPRVKYCFAVVCPGDRTSDHTPSSAICSVTRHNTRASSTVKNYSGALALLLAVCLPEIDLLARLKDRALPGHWI
jgi:hypothetical protein